MKVVSQSNRNVFPVVDAREELIGVVVLNSIRKVLFRQELYHRYRVEQFMEDPAAKIINTDSMEVVMRKFDTTRSWYLPVVDEENHYIGFVSKSKALNTYRQVMVDLSEE